MRGKAWIGVFLILGALLFNGLLIQAQESDPATWPIVYQDDFEDPGSGWQTGETEYAKRSYVDGKYEIQVKDKHLTVWSPFPNDHNHYYDFAAQAEVHVGKGMGEFGFRFYRYWFGIRSDGYYRLRRREIVSGSDNSGTVRVFFWHTLIEWTPCDCSRGKASNQIGIVVRGSEFMLFLNNELLAQISPHNGDYLGSWNCGLYASSFDKAGFTVHFSQLIVSEDPEVRELAADAIDLFYKGGVYTQLERYKKATQCLQKTLKLFRSCSWNHREIDVFLLLGNCWRILANYEKAIGYYRKALMLSYKISDRYREARSLELLGTCYSNLGEYQKAIEYYVTSLKISQKNEEEEAKADRSFALGRYHRILGETERAMDYYESALTSYRNIVHQVQKRIQPLEEKYNLLITRPEMYFNAQKGITAALNNLGNCYSDLGNYQKAIQYYRKSLAPEQKHSIEKRGEAHSLNNLGNCYESLSQYQKAIDYYEDSLAIYREIGNRSGGFKSAWGLARSHWNTGDLQKAGDYYQTAISYVESIRGEIKTEEFKQSFFTSVKDLYEEYMKLLLELGEEQKTLFISERSRARTFLDLLAKGPVRTLKNIKEEGIETGVVKPEAIKQSVNQVIDSLPEHTAVLEYFVGDKNTYVWVISQGNKYGPVKLPQGRAELMEIIIKFREVLEAKKPVDYYLSLLYDWLIRPIEKFLPPTVSDSDKKAPHLIIVPSGPLYYLPFQALRWAGKSPSQHAYLIERYAVSYAPSLATLKYALEMGERQKPAPTFLGLADPYTGDPHLGLPEAQTEVKRVAELFSKPKVYIGSEANEPKVRSSSSQASVILFSTHGKFNPGNPMFSYLLLSPTEETDHTKETDGRLHAYEVFNLPLKSRMVLLSACETLLPSLREAEKQVRKVRDLSEGEQVKLPKEWKKKLTAGDEIVGLTRAFIYAGSPSVLSSLWSVYSETTVELMVAYSKYVMEGKSKVQALRLAQLKVLKEKDQNSTHPIYWAPFNLMGEWR